MSFYSHATGNFYAAIYTDSGGPAVLKWTSGSTPATGGGAWDTVLISAGTPNTLTLDAGDYWLAWQWDSVNSGPSYTAGGANTGAYLAQAYGAFPDPMTGETLSTENWSEYVTYETAEMINVSDSATGTDAIVGIEEWLTITDTGVGIDTAYLLGEVLIDGLRLDHCLRIRVSEPTTIASKPVSSGLPTRIWLGGQGRTVEIEGWVPTVAELNTLTALADGAVHEIQLPTGSRVSVHIPDVNPVRAIEPGKYPYTIRAVERMD
jgi:hypothetical protein